MLYVVTGATGQVGGHVAARLLEGGHRVRVVVRDAQKAEHWRVRGAEVALADLHDTDALRSAFQGADGVFALNPPAYASEDIVEQAHKVCEAIHDAAMSAGIGRMVGLSSVGAHRKSGTGNIQTNHILEQLLGELACATAFIRAAWFMENASGLVPLAREQGIAPSFLAPLDRAIPQVATADIGRVAAELLTSDWQDRRIIELQGPREYTPLDVAAALGEIVGRAVEAVPFPRKEWPGFFKQLGMSASSGECWSEMVDGFNSGWIAFEGIHEHVVGRVDLIDALRPSDK